MRNVWFARGSDTVVLSGLAWLLQWLVSATALEDVTGGSLVSVLHLVDGVFNLTCVDLRTFSSTGVENLKSPLNFCCRTRAARPSDVESRRGLG